MQALVDGLREPLQALGYDGVLTEAVLYPGEQRMQLLTFLLGHMLRPAALESVMSKLQSAPDEASLSPEERLAYSEGRLGIFRHVLCRIVNLAGRIEWMHHAVTCRVWLPADKPGHANGRRGSQGKLLPDSRAVGLHVLAVMAYMMMQKQGIHAR